jgi:hypothetical protein
MTMLGKKEARDRQEKSKRQEARGTCAAAVECSDCGLRRKLTHIPGW